MRMILQKNVARKAGTLAVVGLGGLLAYSAPWWTPSTPRVDVAFTRAALAATAPDAVPATGLASNRASGARWDVSNIDHRRVDMWVRIFSEGKLRPKFATWLERKPRYERMISRELRQRDMPQDLIYLAMIESGFNPRAYSRAHAGGLWQFISETGRRYGLRINRRVDERNNPEKATKAALSYLSDLHDRFGSWYLAAAAYNTGENRVGRIMRQVTGRERGTDRDYYRISHLLPRETRDYVPMMIAAARISKQPARYGF